jgi:hypothetical protein
MSNSSGGFFAMLLDLLASLFGGKKPSTSAPGPQVPADSADEPAQITTVKVLLLVYDPVVNESGQKLSQVMNWKRVEDLVTGFCADINQTSAGLARYEIVQRVDVDEFPVKADGFAYTAETYMDVMRGITPPHQPDGVDYQAILTRFNILPRAANGELDEVWAFAFPHAGFYESVMGGAGAFWCNAPPLRNTASCSRRFIVMGFSYERGVGEMLEAFGHRAESLMLKAFEGLQGEANLWARFTRYDQANPGQAEVGNVHFAPNSERDYDWGNPRLVLSFCDDWFNFPDFQGVVKQVNAGEWGGGDMRAHHLWWLNHFPRVAGRKNGVHNNWWQYLMDANKG